MRTFLIAVLLFCGSLHAQLLISGDVYDEIEKKPLEGAYVYIDGTTISASTDEKGHFRIAVAHKYNAPLIISYMGFETLRVEDPFQYVGRSLKAYMRMEATELDEVVITNKSLFTRAEMLKVFRQQFLGVTRAGRGSRIENESDIYLYYDENKHMLKAKCSKPIRITNKYLKYNIFFNLAEFEVEYKVNSLDFNYMRQSFYAGSTSYTDVSKKGSADKRRKEAYLGSVTHLMHTIKDNSWDAQKFTLYVDKVGVNPADYLTVSDSLGLRKVKVNTVALEATLPKIEYKAGLGKIPEKPNFTKVPVSILRNLDTRAQSGMNFQTDTFYIDENGLYQPIGALMFFGYMGELKVGDMLPVDYVYEL
ncbi:MAG: carboxypeptidase-like regulatory domain-containing protein [Bacteroidia bacterium]